MNALIKIIRLYILGLVVFTSGLLSTLAKEDSNYLFNLSGGPRGESIVLFPSPASNVAFKDALTAINILGVACDGTLIRPRLKESSEETNRMTVEAPGEIIMYRLGLTDLRCWADIELKKEQPNKMRCYPLPNKFSSLEIVYYVRRPNGGHSEPIKTAFVMSDLPIQLVEPTKKDSSQTN